MNSISCVLAIYGTCFLFGVLSSEKWVNVVSPTKQTCFGAKGNSPANFTVPADGWITGLRFQYESGAVRCADDVKYNSKWGCVNMGGNRDAKVRMIVTSAKKEILFPPEVRNSRKPIEFYSNDNHANSSHLTYYNDLEPDYFPKGMVLKLWYSEDLADQSEEDNHGEACVSVKALYKQL